MVLRKRQQVPAPPRGAFSRLPLQASHLLLPVVVLLLLLPLLASCQLPWPTVPPVSTAAVPTSAKTARAPTPAGPTATVPVTPLVTPAPLADLAITAGDVPMYPGPERYSGDIVTFDVIPRNLGQIDPASVTVRIYRGSTDPSNMVASGSVDYPTFDGVPRARLAWAWDTAGLVGDQTLIAWVDPEDKIQKGDEDPNNNIVTFTVHLLPAVERDPQEIAATWAENTTACCNLYYLTGTSADRDMPTITVVTEESVHQVEAELEVSSSNPLNIYFISRVIGHGGYAYEAVALSYLDRHYAGFDLAVVVRHEVTHLLDGKLLQKVYPPAILREGLATWVGGGHFKPEPIPERAAALLQLHRYIGLEQLANDFYRQQHEIGYLEGAAFVGYLIDTYGWDRFRTFYGSLDSSKGSAAAQLDDALSRAFGSGLAGAEEDFRSWLEAHPPTPEEMRDLQDTIALFDTVRRYQAAYDPSAYWLNGFMPDPAAGQARGIVADFLRHPQAPENIALEAMLVAAREGLRQGRYEWTEELVAGVNRVLDTGSFAEVRAADYLAVVQAAAAAGFEAQQIAVNGDIAEVLAVARWPELALEKLTFQRNAAGWRPVAGGGNR